MQNDRIQTYRTFSLIIALVALAPAHARAQVIAPSATEVVLTYQAEFQTRITRERDGATAVDEHFQHLFGVFHSPHWNRVYRLKASLGGIASPRLPIKTRIVSTTPARGEAATFVIRYEAQAVALVHNRVAEAWLRAGRVDLPMPYDLQRIYNERCTDAHYSSVGDYWYFYDPFRDGCTYLLEEPYHRTVSVRVTPQTQRKREVRPDLRTLRGDNGNGALFQVAIIQGFAGSARAKNDESRQNYEALNTEFRRAGFSETVLRDTKVSPLRQFDRTIGEMQVQITHLLVDTGIDAKTARFAKFFKDAAENADVVIYLGHSGLGGNLDIASLEERAGAFRFNPRKKQIFYLESCSSYSYYLELFRSQKTRASIDVLSNGLSSYFHTTVPTIKKFLSVLLNPRLEPTWLEILTELEKPLRGDTYFLNVGGI